ncbi:MAG: response regulator transcription factor [Alistipes sp.]|nr:response regulator transcription factor [Candidatus Alistipes equi]
MKYRVMVVDDECDIVEFVSYNLLHAGYEVISASNGKEAVDKASSFQPHLILMDMLMPVMDGVEACRLIRQNPLLKDTHIVFLSAVSDDEKQLLGYEAGADDYISKPVRMKVLLSRVAAIMKRIDLVENVENKLLCDIRCFSTEQGPVTLSQKEFEILKLLYDEPEKYHTREEIYSTVWGDNVIVGNRTLDVHIRHIRSKIGEQHISTMKCFGFKYEN